MMSTSNSDQNIAQEERTIHKRERSLVIEVAGASILGAASIVVSQLTTSILPRMAWGIAFFDPVSLFWIISFMVFGFRAGLLTCLVGTIGLMPYDPTPLVGPVMKLVATSIMIIVPYFYMKIIRHEFHLPTFLKGKYFIPSMTIAWLTRSIAMIGLNALYIVYVWEVPVEFFNLEWLGNASISGWLAVYITVFLLNSIQSVADVIIPYLIAKNVNITPK